MHYQLGKEQEDKLAKNRLNKEIECLKYEKLKMEQMLKETESINRSSQHQINSLKDKISFYKAQSENTEMVNKNLVDQVEKFNKRHNNANNFDEAEDNYGLSVDAQRFRTAEIDYKDTINKKDEIIKNIKAEVESCKRKALLGNLLFIKKQLRIHTIHHWNIQKDPNGSCGIISKTKLRFRSGNYTCLKPTHNTKPLRRISKVSNGRIRIRRKEPRNWISR